MADDDRRDLAEHEVPLPKLPLIIAKPASRDQHDGQTRSGSGKTWLDDTDLVRIITTALLSIDGVESLASSLREKDGEIDAETSANAKEVVGNVIKELFRPIQRESRSWLREINRTLNQVRGAVRRLQESVPRVFDVSAVLFDGDLKHRFETEYPDEKRVIAKCIADRYFADRSTHCLYTDCSHHSIRCFLQASTTVLHLAEELRSRGLGKNSLIHTNSTVLSYVLLGEDSDYRIYTLCGTSHDPKCCGWLYDMNDKQAESHLRSLFGRKTDPLEIAFVTPQYMTIDGSLGFAREETVHLVQALLEEAPRIVIASPGPRIYLSREDVKTKHPDLTWYWAKAEKRQGKQQFVEFIIAGELTHLNKDRRHLDPLTAIGQCFVGNIGDDILLPLGIGVSDPP